MILMIVEKSETFLGVYWQSHWVGLTISQKIAYQRQGKHVSAMVFEADLHGGSGTWNCFSKG